jgi:hypothetical protein
MTVGDFRNAFVTQRQRRGAELLFRAMNGSPARSCGEDQTSLASFFRETYARLKELDGGLYA